jgi:hypothetical protein
MRSSGNIGLLLVVDVEVHELFAERGVAAEVRRVGDAGQLALEVGRLAGAALGWWRRAYV